jgi:hypothetical protein
VTAIFRFLPDEVIDFDVDPRELRGQERPAVFCAFLRAIGRRPGRPVLMSPEGGGAGIAVLWFEPGADRFVGRHDR